MSKKLVCNVRRCNWHGTEDAVLKAPDPFDAGDVWGCPTCKSINSFEYACDEPDCWISVACGTPTETGYRNTCIKHRPEEAK